MKNWFWCFVVAAAVFVALVGIWRPEYISCVYGAVHAHGRVLLTLFVFLLAGCLLACTLYTTVKGKTKRSNGVDKTADTCEELSPLYPASSNWKRISEFRYKSDLKLMRLKDGLPNLDREAQYIIAKDYKVSFVLDGAPHCIRVPRGTLTDFASVPRLFRIFVGRVGPHLEAAIIHDYLYIAWQLAGLVPDEGMRRFADKLMLVAMHAAGMGCKARLIYWAVRARSPRSIRRIAPGAGTGRGPPAAHGGPPVRRSSACDHHQRAGVGILLEIDMRSLDASLRRQRSPKHD